MWKIFQLFTKYQLFSVRRQIPDDAEDSSKKLLWTDVIPVHHFVVGRREVVTQVSRGEISVIPFARAIKVFTSELEGVAPSEPEPPQRSSKERAAWLPTSGAKLDDLSPSNAVARLWP